MSHGDTETQRFRTPIPRSPRRLTGSVRRRPVGGVPSAAAALGCPLAGRLARPDRMDPRTGVWFDRLADPSDSGRARRLAPPSNRCGSVSLCLCGGIPLRGLPLNVRPAKRCQKNRELVSRRTRRNTKPFINRIFVRFPSLRVFVTSSCDNGVGVGTQARRPGTSDGLRSMRPSNAAHAICDS
jgi:hypothetical protein